MCLSTSPAVYPLFDSVCLASYCSCRDLAGHPEVHPRGGERRRFFILDYPTCCTDAVSSSSFLPRRRFSATLLTTVFPTFSISRASCVLLYKDIVVDGMINPSAIHPDAYEPCLAIAAGMNENLSASTPRRLAPVMITVSQPHWPPCVDAEQPGSPSALSRHASQRTRDFGLRLVVSSSKRPVR